jgi:hypothetical protein
MTRILWVTVLLDDKPTASDVFIGDPSKYEAEAFILVHVPQSGDYILSLGNENYRETTVSEYMRLPSHVWMTKRIGDGTFTRPMPFERLNEFRLSAHGHLVTVRF